MKHLPHHVHPQNQEQKVFKASASTPRLKSAVTCGQLVE